MDKENKQPIHKLIISRHKCMKKFSNKPAIKQRNNEKLFVQPDQ